MLSSLHVTALYVVLGVSLPLPGPPLPSLSPEVQQLLQFLGLWGVGLWSHAAPVLLVLVITTVHAEAGAWLRQRAAGCMAAAAGAATGAGRTAATGVAHARRPSLDRSSSGPMRSPGPHTSPFPTALHTLPHTGHGPPTAHGHAHPPDPPAHIAPCSGFFLSSVLPCIAACCGSSLGWLLLPALGLALLLALPAPVGLLGLGYLILLPASLLTPTR